MKNIIIGAIVIILIGIGAYFLFFKDSPREDVTPEPNDTEVTPSATSTTEETEEVDETKTEIGTSVEDREIMAYHFGTGEEEVLFVGGIHGGYEWNTVLLAYELMDHLEDNPDVIPENVRVTVIPVLNPDGLNKVVGTAGKFTREDVPASIEATIPGRFNANNVDLNRNFDCDWQASGTWQSRTVSGGSEAFSEPESQAFENYVEENDPIAVVVWYSAAGGVFASSCHNGISGETSTLTSLYADASGYRAYENFDFYAITGDMVNWLASENIPAISVLLTNHTDVEWNKNRAGVEAILNHYAD